MFPTFTFALGRALNSIACPGHLDAVGLDRPDTTGLIALKTFVGLKALSALARLNALSALARLNA